MAMLQNIHVILDNFDIAGMCTDENYVQKWIAELCVDKYYFLVLPSLAMQTEAFEEEWALNSFQDLPFMIKITGS